MSFGDTLGAALELGLDYDTGWRAGNGPRRKLFTEKRPVRHGQYETTGFPELLRSSPSTLARPEVSPKLLWSSGRGARYTSPTLL